MWRMGAFKSDCCWCLNAGHQIPRTHSRAVLTSHVNSAKVALVNQRRLAATRQQRTLALHRARGAPKRHFFLEVVRGHPSPPRSLAWPTLVTPLLAVSAGVAALASRTHHACINCRVRGATSIEKRQRENDEAECGERGTHVHTLRPHAHPRPHVPSARVHLPHVHSHSPSLVSVHTRTSLLRRAPQYAYHFHTFFVSSPK